MKGLGLAGHGSWSPLDQAYAQSLERTLRRLEPDALYRRRLRGELLNRYVATREGLVRPPQRPRAMGALGRGVLYASLAVAIASSAAGAAAAESLPGDPLYPVKLRFEEIRLQIAPQSMRADLMAMALDERLHEMEELARAGNWSQVAAAADAVAQAEELLAGTQGAPGQSAVSDLSQHAAVLRALIDTAPAAAQDGLNQAIEAATSQGNPVAQPGLPPQAVPSFVPGSAAPQSAEPGSASEERQPPRSDQGAQKPPNPGS